MSKIRGRADEREASGKCPENVREMSGKCPESVR